MYICISRLPSLPGPSARDGWGAWRLWLLPLLLLIGACAGFDNAGAADQVERAELPRQWVDTDPPAAEGRRWQLAAGDDLQAALDRAQPGDVIELAAGAEFKGPFTLPFKAGEGWITVRSAAAERLPGEGERVTPAHASAMPVLSAERDAVLRAAPGAHHWRFVGLEMRPASGVALYNVVLLSAGPERPEDVPHHFIFDRCYIHGDPQAGSRRGIALNGAHVAVINSHLSDFKEVGADSQALMGWAGPGPFKIVNNYLEGAGENIMFGGSTPAMADLVPADIEVRGNHLAKPLRWREGAADYEGKNWSVKNLFELKNARRVLVEGNLMEHNWPHAQNGFAILFTVRNEAGEAPWAVVEDVTFRNNLLRRIGAGINMLGFDDNAHPSGQTRNLTISNNLFLEVGGDWGNGRLFQFLDALGNVVIEHNTALGDGHILYSEGRPHRGVAIRDNIFRHNRYGMAGAGHAPGNDTLRRYFPGAFVHGNLLIGASAGQYPRGNLAPASLEEVGFRDPRVGDYRLVSKDIKGNARTRGTEARFTTTTSTTEEAEDNAPGADLDALCRALSRSERPGFCAAN